MSDPTPFDRVIERIKALGWTERGTCAKAGLDPTMLASIRRNGGAMALATLEALARALGCTMGELLGETSAGGDPDRIRVPLDRLDASPLNPRKTFPPDKIEELAQSILAQGLLQNLVVRPRADTDRWWIVAGERRQRALLHLQATGRLPAELATLGVPALVRRIEDGEHKVLALLENLQREDVNPMEEADGLAELQALDPARWTTAAIASQIGTTQRHVQLRLKLVSGLAPESRKALREERIRLAHARVLASLPPALQERLLGAAETGTADQLREQAQRTMAPAAKAIFDVAASGLETWEDPVGGDIYFTDREGFREAQRAAIKKLIQQLRRDEKPSFIKQVEPYQVSWYRPGGTGILISFDQWEGTVEIHRGLRDHDSAAPAVDPAAARLARAKAEFETERNTARTAFAAALGAPLVFQDAMRLIICRAIQLDAAPLTHGSWVPRQEPPFQALARHAGNPAALWQAIAALPYSDIGDTVTACVRVWLTVPPDKPPHPALLALAEKYAVDVPPILLLDGRKKAAEIARRAQLVVLDDAPGAEAEEEAA